jgi:hypothetical protein
MLMMYLPFDFFFVNITLPNARSVKQRTETDIGRYLYRLVCENELAKEPVHMT